MAVYCHPRHWNHNLSSSVLRAEVDEKVHLALGCHPKQANLWNSSSSSKLESALETLRPQLVALGECGLDYSEGSSVPKEQQKRVFKQQVNRSKYPVVTAFKVFLNHSCCTIL